LVRLQTLKPLQNAVRAAAVHLRGAIAQYPPRKRVTRRQAYGRPFETPKQRRFFFWALRAGVIQVPYRRGQSPGSEDLGNRWAVKKAAGGLAYIVGNNASYVRWVQDSTRQARMMRIIGWKTAQDVVKEEAPTVAKMVKSEIEKQLRR